MKNAVLLGKGAFSEVYRVSDERTGELTVYKVSSRKDLAAREGELLEKIKHPLFPAYKGRMSRDGKLVLMMEYICGESLQKHIHRRGGISPQRAAEIAAELSEGLIYLHELSEPVIFRDIKPENILIQQNGRVRLVDLGCAGSSGKEQKNRAGSRGYAAPEQFVKGEGIGVESDVYALGKVLEFMLADVDKVPRGLKSVIEGAVQENPQDRIPDMRAMKKLLLPYREKKLGKRIWLEWKERGKRKSAFSYKLNVRKGL